MSKGSIRTVRYVNERSEGTIQPLKGGFEVKFFDFPGKLKPAENVEFEEYSQGDLVKAYDARLAQGSVGGVAKTINGKGPLPIKKKV